MAQEPSQTDSGASITRMVSQTHLYSQDGLESHLWFGDLDGDGHTEVLFLYHPAADPKSHSTMLICYSDSGKEKWRWTPGRVLPETESRSISLHHDGFWSSAGYE